MMQRKSIITIIMFLIMIYPVLVWGQNGQTIDYGIEPAEYERVGQSGYQFLKIPTNARTAGMGGIATAIAHGDASSALANPASIADVEDIDVSLTRINWFADIGYQSGSVVKNFGKWGHFGMHFIYLDYGDMIRNEYNEIFDDGISTGRSEVAVDQGTFGAHDLAIGLSYSRQITADLQIGGNLRYIEEKLDDATASNWAIDIGTVFYTGLKSFRIAMVGRNFGPDVNFAEYDERIQLEPASVKMPMSFSLGGAYDVLEYVNGSPHLWTVAAEFVHPNDGPEKVNIGTEYTYQNFLSLRGGYRFNYDEEGLTLGGGIKVKTSTFSVTFNYSYWAFGVLGDINMFSIGIGL